MNEPAYAELRRLTELRLDRGLIAPHPASPAPARTQSRRPWATRPRKRKSETTDSAAKTGLPHRQRVGAEIRQAAGVVGCLALAPAGDQNGDGLHGYNIVKNEKGTIVYDKHIDFND